MKPDNDRAKGRTRVSVPCCVVGPSQQQVIPGWSRPVAVISPELSEATTCAAGKKKQGDERITERHDRHIWPTARFLNCLVLCDERERAGGKERKLENISNKTHNNIL